MSFNWCTSARGLIEEKEKTVLHLSNSWLLMLYRQIFQSSAVLFANFFFLSVCLPLSLTFFICDQINLKYCSKRVIHRQWRPRRRAAGIHNWLHLSNMSSLLSSLQCAEWGASQSVSEEVLNCTVQYCTVILQPRVLPNAATTAAAETPVRCTFFSTAPINCFALLQTAKQLYIMMALLII